MPKCNGADFGMVWTGHDHRYRIGLTGQSDIVSQGGVESTVESLNIHGFFYEYCSSVCR